MVAKATELPNSPWFRYQMIDTPTHCKFKGVIKKSQCPHDKSTSHAIDLVTIVISTSYSDDLLLIIIYTKLWVDVQQGKDEGKFNIFLLPEECYEADNIVKEKWDQHRCSHLTVTPPGTVC